MIYLLIAFLFFGSILVYFQIADHYNIIDHPNERSSHSVVTIRGGGIVFLFAAVAALIMHPAYWLAITAIFIIGIISFLDDRYTLSGRIRILFHLIAVTLIFFFLNVFDFEPFYVLLILYVIVIGIINMYNFMDGINGITGIYSIVVLGGLQYINLYQLKFIEVDMIWLPILACCTFLYFNFRTTARCFAGDVGSVTIALWIVMLLLKLILISHNWTFILFLAVYGVDTVLTIIHRLVLKQNIFKAHRLHFYQLLVNEQGFAHLWVASAYAFLQGLLITIIILNAKSTNYYLFASILPLAAIYFIFKPKLMK